MATIDYWAESPLDRRKTPWGRWFPTLDAMTSGQRVASVGATGRVPGCLMELRLWDLASGQSTVLDRDPRLWLFAAFSPDSRTLAVPLRGSPSEAVLWDVATGKIQSRLRHPSGQGVYAVALSPDGRYLATGLISSDDPVWLWCLAWAASDREEPDAGLLFAVVWREATGEKRAPGR